jgi:O-antigen ligase
LIPFQRRFHGFFDLLSRSLPLPDFPLPEYFSRKIHLFTSDFLILALALTLLFCFKVSLREFFWDGPSKYLTLLFFVLLLSSGISISKTYSLQYFRLFQFSLFFLFFNSICCIRQKIDLVRFVHRLAWLLVCVAFFECGVSICQYFFQDSVGLRFLGERSPKGFPFANQGEHLWLLGKIFGSKPDSIYLYRVGGTFLHPNILGGFLFCSVMASYYLCIPAIGKCKRLFLLGMIFLQFFTLYLSFSRSAVLALLLSTLAWCFLQLKHAIKNGGYRSAAFRRLILLAGTVLCSALIGIVLLYPQLRARGGIISYNSVSQESDSERIVYMKVALDMIERHPLLGVGYNNFQIYAHELQPRFPHSYLHSKVHNIYLLIASETGLIGGGIFLLFLWTLLRTALSVIFSPYPNRWENRRLSNADFSSGLGMDLLQARAFLLSVFLGFLVIGCCDFYFFENPQGAIPFFGIAGLLYGISASTAENRGKKCVELHESPVI